MKELLNLALAGQDPNYSERYRDLVLNAFGVKPEVISFIKSHSTFKVDSTIAAQGWFPPSDYSGTGKIILGYFQAEGCLHECAHVWYHWRRYQYPQVKLALAKALVLLADSTYSAWAEATRLAKLYCRGDGIWKGMFAEGSIPVTDLHNLTEVDLPRINDWEIFAGLCSFTMGQFKTGARQLIPGSWWAFESMFTGSIKAKPYYE